ncbi:MAG TPA: tetratricopeptide repeat protein, partial [Croceibacterium sp.]|nr:tetratricopeptide repeat protein [Croceibacterium sp.]
MRYVAPALALSLAVALTASVGMSAERQPDPRAAALVVQGKSHLAAGQVQSAIDSFEAALAVDPGYTG